MGGIKIGIRRQGTQHPCGGRGGLRAIGGGSPVHAEENIRSVCRGTYQNSATGTVGRHWSLVSGLSVQEQESVLGRSNMGMG